MNISRIFKRSTWKITAFIYFFEIVQQFVKTNCNDDLFCVLFNLSENLGLSGINAVNNMSVQLCLRMPIYMPFNIGKIQCY